MKKVIVALVLAVTAVASASRPADVVDQAKSVVDSLERSAPYMTDVQADQVSYLLRSIDEVLGTVSDSGDKDRDEGNRGDHDYRKERFE